MSEPIDDFDLEVSALEAAPASASALTHEPIDAASPHETPQAERPARSTRCVSLVARRPRAQRLVRAGSALALLALLVSAALLIPSGNRDTVLHLLTPVRVDPTAPLQAGGDAFLWEHSAPWGQLFVDGNPGPDVRGSAVQHDAHGFPQGAPFHLTRGRHSLQYNAYPFFPLACIVSVPVSRDDTCPLAHDVDFSSLIPDAPATRLLDLQATMDQLPKGYLDQLLVTMQIYLDSLASMLPSGELSVGDHYLNRAGQVTQASGAMRIEAQFRLDSSIVQQDGVSCATLCAATGIGESPSATGWALSAPVALTWRYTTPPRQVVLSDGPALPLGAVPFTEIPLQVGWNSGFWQTPTAVLGVSETDPVICPTGAHALRVAQAPRAAPQYQWPLAASTAELGCLLAGSEMDPHTAKPTGPLALVLYRAGALLAVNAQAHQILPGLPLASAHERALALAAAPADLP
jgi:hypothetical protein